MKIFEMRQWKAGMWQGSPYRVDLAAVKGIEGAHGRLGRLHPLVEVCEESEGNSGKE